LKAKLQRGFTLSLGLKYWLINKNNFYSTWKNSIKEAAAITNRKMVYNFNSKQNAGIGN
jgi:hypothetical protein